jgi:hypothetical protein
LNDASQIVLRNLDGCHDCSALLNGLRQSRIEGRLVVPELGVGLSNPTSVMRPGDPGETVGLMLDRCLDNLARFALLMG